MAKRLRGAVVLMQGQGRLSKAKTGLGKITECNSCLEESGNHCRGQRGRRAPSLTCPAALGLQHALPNKSFTIVLGLWLSRTLQDSAPVGGWAQEWENTGQLASSGPVYQRVVCEVGLSPGVHPFPAQQLSVQPRGCRQLPKQE